MTMTGDEAGGKRHAAQVAAAQGRWRARHVEAGRKAVTLWLPADSLARLDALRADGEGRAEVVARLIDRAAET